MYVDHMTDEELHAFLEPWGRLADALDPSGRSHFPAWFIKRRDAERRRLLAVLVSRGACPRG